MGGPRAIRLRGNAVAHGGISSKVVDHDQFVERRVDSRVEDLPAVPRDAQPETYGAEVGRHGR